MMARTAWPTVASGDSWSAAQHNTYGRDNDLAYWQYTTAGDLVYATSSSTLARLGIGAARQVLRSTGSAPEWAASGGLQAISVVEFAPAGQSTTGTTFVDITGATLNISLPTTCTIVVLASVTGYHETTGRNFFVRAVVDGTADAGLVPYNGGAYRNESLPYIHYRTGVTSGTRTVKLQFSGDASGTAFIERGRLIVMAFSE